MLLDKRKVTKSFGSSAASYSTAAVLQGQVAGELLDRLELVKLVPRVIVDMGCGPADYWSRFRTLFDNGPMLVGLDISLEMLRQAQHSRRWWPGKRRPLVCADMESVPMADSCADLVFSNLAMQWCCAETFTAEAYRLLKPGGLLVFSSFGPDTLCELKQSWAKVDGHRHVHDFVDMHDVGDQLLNAGFVDTVMDCDRITLTYQSPQGVLSDLRAIGARNASPARSRSLTGKGAMQKLYRAYEDFRTPDKVIPATYEVVYGHAWIPDQKSVSGQSCKIPLVVR